VNDFGVHVSNIFLSMGLVFSNFLTFLMLPIVKGKFPFSPIKNLFIDLGMVFLSSLMCVSRALSYVRLVLPSSSSEEEIQDYLKSQARTLAWQACKQTITKGRLELNEANESIASCELELRHYYKLYQLRRMSVMRIHPSVFDDLSLVTKLRMDETLNQNIIKLNGLKAEYPNAPIVDPKLLTKEDIEDFQDEYVKHHLQVIEQSKLVLENYYAYFEKMHHESEEMETEIIRMKY
jgi:hypothetical protein